MKGAAADGNMLIQLQFNYIFSDAAAAFFVCLLKWYKL